MNRKQKAIEDKHLSVSRRNSRQKSTDKSKYITELIEKNRECKEIDVINVVRLHYVITGTSILYFSRSLYKWEINAIDIVKVACQQAKYSWNKDTLFVDHLEPIAVAELHRRQSPLYKIL